MEGFGGSQFSVKKRRSATSRRPRPDSQFVVEGRDASSLSSTPSSDNGSKLSPDQNLGYAPRIASVNNLEGGGSSRKIRKEERKYGEVSGFYGNGSSRGGQSGNALDAKRCSEGVLAPANWRSSGNVAGRNSGSAENKLKKVKLKVGGVTRTFHPKSTTENDGSGYSVKSSRSADGSRHRQKLILQDNSDDDHTPAEKRDGFQGAPSRDSSGGGLPRAPKENSHGKLFEESSSGKQMVLSETVRKSKRVPKRRVLDSALDEGDEDDEIRYIEKLKTSKVSTDNCEFDDDMEGSNKKKNISKVSKSKKVAYDVDEDYSSSRSGKESRKKSRPGREFEDTDYLEDEEPVSDDGIDPRRKKQKKESIDTLPDAREPLTTRQRALHSGKGASPGESLIEFPNGLPPAPPRRQKEKLSEVEQQAKKAEAAQRRKMQVEKAAKESEAEAIRKILGQDSNRKKKEEKIRKERDEMAQKKAAESLVLASNSVRWVMGPTGTVVTFGEDVGLPTIFEPKTSSYPPPREKCAASSCPNAYKYRDSKSKLPLCSLQCYKAVQGSSQTGPTC